MEGYFRTLVSQSSGHWEERSGGEALVAGFGKTLPQSLHQTLPATPALHNPSHTTTIPHSPVSLASCKKKELLVCLCSCLPIEHHIFCSKNVVYFGEENCPTSSWAFSLLNPITNIPYSNLLSAIVSFHSLILWSHYYDRTIIMIRP